MTHLESFPRGNVKLKKKLLTVAGGLTALSGVLLPSPAQRDTQHRREQPFLSRQRGPQDHSVLGWTISHALAPVAALLPMAPQSGGTPLPFTEG